MKPLRVRRQEQVAVFGLAAPKLSRAAEARPLLPASAAAVVHTAEVAGGTSVVRFVALVFAGWH